MWPFKRQASNDKTVPPEVKKYYASEHRERVGLAWLIAFVSLLVTIAVMAGLFFGGRWAYRKIAHKNNPPTVSQGGNDVNTPAPVSNPSTPSQPNDLQPAAPSQNSGSSSSSSSSSNSSSNNQSTTTPAPAQVTNTGPGNTVAIFLAVTLLATAAHWQYQRRNILRNN